MKLYEFAPTRSIRARWVLQELGVEFESVTINMLEGENRSPEFLTLNPAGKLPVLVDGDLILTALLRSFSTWPRNTAINSLSPRHWQNVLN